MTIFAATTKKPPVFFPPIQTGYLASGMWPNQSPEPLWGLSIGMMGLSKSLLDKMFITRSATEWSGVVREAMWLTNP